MKSRVANSNPEDALQGKLAQSLYSEKGEYSRIFYYAQVIRNDDPKKLNRIKVRIPIIDDSFYLGRTKAEGDNLLPWCLSFSNNFIETPEVNTVVIVAIFDPKTPYFGRLWFDCITEYNTPNLLENLTPETKLYNNWNNADNVLELKNPKPKKLNDFEAKANIIHPVGIRGKGENKLELGKDFTLLTQFHKDKDKESFLHFTATKSTLESADLLKLRSKKGENTEYNVIFDKKMFEYLDSLHKLIAKTIALLNSTPAISPAGPCTPGPNAKQLVNEHKSLKQALKKLKKEGSSKKIFVN